AVAVDHRGHPALAPERARRALARVGPRGRGKLDCFHPGSLLFQSKSELTDWSLCVYPIALASSPAIESTLSCGNWRSGGNAMVLVTATSVTGAAESRSTAGPDSSACVAQMYT